MGNQEHKQASISVPGVFRLDPDGLRVIHAVFLDELNRSKDHVRSPKVQIDVSRGDGSKVSHDSIDEVLIADNGRPNQIEAISIRLECYPKISAEATFKSGTGILTGVSVSVSGTDLEACDRVQTRCLRKIDDVAIHARRGTTYWSIVISGLLGLLVLVVLAVRTRPRVGPAPEGLTLEAIDSAITSADLMEKLDTILRFQRQAMLPRPEAVSTSVGVYVLLVCWLMLVTFLLLDWLLPRCIPQNVFVWGVEGKRVEKAIGRTRFWVGTVFLSLLLGVVGNLIFSKL